MAKVLHSSIVYKKPETEIFTKTKMADDEIENLKTSFRTKGFPLNMEEVLTKIDELTFQSFEIRSRQQYQERVNEINDLIAEFIFLEIDSNGASVEASGIKDLQIVKSISEFMYSDGKRNNRSILNALYVSLFASDSPRRMKIAVNLISFAISFSNVPLLTASVALIQTHSYSSTYSLQFMEKVIFELELLLSVSKETVYGLAHLAPIFAGNILTRIVEKYRYEVPEDQHILFPSHKILVMIVEWLGKDIRLCMVPILCDFAMNVLPSARLVRPRTSHFTLIYWCIRARLEQPPDMRLYTKLELMILKSISTIPNQGLMHYVVVVSDDLIPVVQLIESTEYPGRQLPAIRFLIKVIRGLLVKKVLEGCTNNLIRSLRSLPYNEGLVVLVEEMGMIL